MSRVLQGLEQLGELSLSLQSLEALEARKTAWRQRLHVVKELVLSLNQCPNVAREEKMELPLANLLHPSDSSAGGRLHAI